jgi:hypothetical protein
VTRAALILALLAACGDDLEPGFALPLGARCWASVEPLCAGGRGVCVESRCEPQCSGRWPACEAGHAEVVRTELAGEVCICRPSSAGEIGSGS